jgi:hypothetical protein
MQAGEFMGMPIGSQDYYYSWLNHLGRHASRIFFEDFPDFRNFSLRIWLSPSLINFDLFPKKLAA